MSLSANSKVLVIGSNSFSGSHFVAYCLERGAEVVGVSRSAEIDPVFLAYRWKSQANFRFRQIDLNHQLDDLKRLLQEFQPAYIVNFAAQGMVAQSWASPLDWYRTNLQAMVGLYDLLRDCPFLQRFVQASTPEVYGATPDWVGEDCPLNPTTPYAISKAACDFHLLAYHRAYGFPVALTRAANVCGPGQQLYRIIPRALLSAYSGERMQLDGGGISQRCFIHIADVCAATWEILTRAEPGAVYHLSNRELTSIRALVEAICELTGVAFEELAELGPARLGQDSAYLLDSSRAQRELGWQPRHPLPEILAETRDWVRANQGTLSQQPRHYEHKP
jgi:dTDP-glucose 4,6-dehydratase